jgi:hypothetical protein
MFSGSGAELEFGSLHARMPSQSGNFRKRQYKRFLRTIYHPVQSRAEEHGIIILEVPLELH